MTITVLVLDITVFVPIADLAIFLETDNYSRFLTNRRKQGLESAQSQLSSIKFVYTVEIRSNVQ